MTVLFFGTRYQWKNYRLSNLNHAERCGYEVQVSRRECFYYGDVNILWIDPDKKIDSQLCGVKADRLVMEFYAGPKWFDALNMCLLKN